MTVVEEVVGFGGGDGAVGVKGDDGLAEFVGPEGVVDLFGEVSAGGIGVGFADDLLVAGEVAVIDEVGGCD